jgi:uncharacterized protein (DUF2235 family)
MKRIVLCFDGTWNTPDDSGDVDANTATNVHRLYQAVLDRDGGGIEQRAWYQAGVGTRWYNRISGGVAGVGLTRNLLDGYKRLIELYQDGDQIFIFGFSRGAYTARSLGGLIRNCGVLREPRARLINEAHQIYRTRGDGADSEQARAFRSRFAREVEIECLGVWDTVGALGIPLRSFDFFNRQFYEFHDTRLSGAVRNAFQALALDEHRQPYQATMWDPSSRPGQRLEQAWFPGAHANVGGGYRNDRQAEIALAWMMDRAAECGLAFDPAKRPALSDPHWSEDLKDSFAEFLRGLFRLVSKRYYRPVGATHFGDETLDEAALQRFKRRADYRPSNPVGPHLKQLLDAPELVEQVPGAQTWHVLQGLAGRSGS